MIRKLIFLLTCVCHKLMSHTVGQIWHQISANYLSFTVHPQATDTGAAVEKLFRLTDSFLSYLIISEKRGNFAHKDFFSVQPVK